MCRTASVLITVWLAGLAGCTQSGSGDSDCAKIAAERERIECVAHKESTKETDLTKIPSKPKKW
jgi:hypothetical protein